MPCTLWLQQSLAWPNLPKGKDSVVLTFDVTNDDIASQMVVCVLHCGLALEQSDHDDKCPIRSSSSIFLLTSASHEASCSPGGTEGLHLGNTSLALHKAPDEWQEVGWLW